MKQIYLILCLWTISLINLSAQVHLEQKAKNHFLEKNWREATILYELCHNTQLNFTEKNNYGRAIVASYKWGEANRLERMYKIAIQDSLSFKNIINLSDKAMNELKIGNEMGSLLVEFIEIESSINDQLTNEIIAFLIDKKEFEKAYKLKTKQVEKRTLSTDDRLLLAKLALENNETDSALEFYRAVLRTDPFHIDANNGLGSILYVKGKIIYDDRPKENHYFSLNIDEQYNKYLWIKDLCNRYFDEATSALRKTLVMNSNQYTTKTIQIMEEVRNECNNLEQKLLKTEKYKHGLMNKKTN